MDNLRKNERNLQYFRQQRESVRNNNNNDDNQRNFFRNTRDFDMNLYEKGRTWQKNGFPLSGASDTFKRNLSFIKGFNKEGQLKKITKREEK